MRFDDEGDATDHRGLKLPVSTSKGTDDILWRATFEFLSYFEVPSRGIDTCSTGWQKSVGLEFSEYVRTLCSGFGSQCPVHELFAIALLTCNAIRTKYTSHMIKNL